MSKECQPSCTASIRNGNEAVMCIQLSVMLVLMCRTKSLSPWSDFTILFDLKFGRVLLFDCTN